jgi:signal transduction histidine kinase
LRGRRALGSSLEIVTEGGRTSSLFDATRLGLARMALSRADELTRALEQACRTSARALGVERTGVWFITRDGSELVCAALYELSIDRCSSGDRLRLSNLPGYLAPVFRLGQVVGVVRHEHIGAPREWSSRDRNFAAAVADLVAVLLEQATRLDVEAALAEQRERIVKAERMEALSRMSAGVAHDFNNVLTAMMLKVEALRLERASDRELDQALREVLDSGQRGARLVQQLLTFAKAKAPAPRPVDLTRTTLVRGQATLRVSQPTTAVLVSVDPTQIEQVILNLVVNARDASTQQDAEVTVELALEPDHALLVVADQGAGMDPATRDQVFEPFFTTKSHGSGLGLSTVYSIVQQAGGTVTVESAEGRGTTFSVRLPLIQ